ncbi:MAG: hypothetical protein GXY43_08475 [Clostridiaceae bacterium]|nr:hypothetical protein [Clostridiaceae bacterium]
MKKALLIASIICDDILSFVLSFVLWAIIVYLLQGTSSLVRSYYEAVDLAETSGLTHKVLVSKSLICEFSFDDDFEQTLETISDLPGVKSCAATAFGSFFLLIVPMGSPFISIRFLMTYMAICATRSSPENGRAPLAKLRFLKT